MNKKNLGVALSRNKAIKECTGPYIAFIDSDDIWKKNKLLYQINYMKKNNYKNVKIFADGADFKEMISLSNSGFIKGLTTNPSLMKKNKIKNYEEFARKVLKKVKKKPISFEVFSDNLEEMKQQAEKINSWGKNVYVKIPVVNSKGVFTGPVIKELSDKGIKLNITAVYTFEQTEKIYKKINKKTKSIISIFAGRMADKGKDPLPIFKKSISLTKKNKNIEILWASTREAYNFIQAKQLNCNIITMPPKVIKVSVWARSFKFTSV